MPKKRSNISTSSPDESFVVASAKSSTRHSSRNLHKSPSEPKHGFGQKLAEIAELVSDASDRPEQTAKERIAEEFHTRFKERGTLDELSVPVRSEPMWSLKTWLEWLFDEPEKSVRKRLDLVYDRVDDWLLDGQFEKADQIFELLQEQLFEQALSCLELTVGFLTVTNGAQEHLKKRAEFVSQFRNALLEREGKQRADALLSGLE